MNQADFKLYDVSDFPLVRIKGSELPPGYAPQWVKEMEALLAQPVPFAFVFLDSNDNPTHEDQKAQTKWIKSHKKPLAAICKGFVSIEPDRAKRLLKRAQALAIVAAFGLRFSIATDLKSAEARAKKLLADQALEDDED